MDLFDQGWRYPGEEPEGRRVLSVGELVERMREKLETSFFEVAVRGEISRFTRASSGHLYLNLQGVDGSVLPVVMFRTEAARLDFQPREGSEVTVWGRATLYAQRGSYQVIAGSMQEESGVGALARAFEAVKARLEADGLFAEERKRPLPFRPVQLAVVTSAGGAAVHDFMDTLLTRCPRVRVTVVDVRVQGATAAAEIARVLQRVHSLVPGAQVVVVTRGGGSLEDLWPFNEERLARAVAACKLPVVSAVGHETDFTICDFVADVRAKTPTEAAYLVVPDLEEELHMVRTRRRQLRHAMQRRLERPRAKLESIRRSSALAGPRSALRLEHQRVAELGRSLRGWIASRRDLRPRVEELRERVERQLPDTEAMRTDVEELVARCRRRLPDAEALARVAAQMLGHARLSLRHRLAARREAVTALGRHLHAVSPEAVLERGYSITTREEDDEIVRDPRQVEPGDGLVTRVAGGTIRSRVTERDEPETD